MVMRLTLKEQLEFNEVIYRLHLNGAQYSFPPFSMPDPFHISLIEPHPMPCSLEITVHLRISPQIDTICLSLRLPLVISWARETQCEPKTWVLSFKPKDAGPKLSFSHQSRMTPSPVRDISLKIIHHLPFCSTGQNLALFEIHPRGSAPSPPVPSLHCPPVLLTLLFIRILYHFPPHIPTEGKVMGAQGCKSQVQKQCRQLDGGGKDFLNT